MASDEKILPGDIIDLLVIGGGINGTGVARDAAGRGLSVLLCEQDDLARYTSSSSTKLIHGGLRYLEHFDFKLVRHALQEREVLLRSAPHIIWPLRFVLPHHRALRPRWLIRLGLFVYDHLGKREILPGSHGINLQSHAAGNALKPEFTRGFEYSDCWVQDARLVVLNAMDASERGAAISVRTRCNSLKRGTDFWEAELVSKDSGAVSKIRARAIVNAAGPWVEQIAGLYRASHSDHGVRLVKGSHIIVPALFEHDYVYIFQNADDRVMFAIPYENNYTLLGTTDVEITSTPETAAISDDEIQYICDNANQYFSTGVSPEDIVHSYTGVRPLFDDAAENASEATRDYVLHLDSQGPPVVSVYGGKITTYRKLSEQVVNMLSGPLRFTTAGWTAGSVLPGGDIPELDRDKFIASCLELYPWCDPGLIRTLAGNYGTRVHSVLRESRSMADLGIHFGAGLYQAEVKYLMENEWAVQADDFIWRRTRAGLEGGAALKQKLEDWLSLSRVH